MTGRSLLVVRDEARGRVRWQWLGAMQVDRCPIVVGWHAHVPGGGGKPLWTPVLGGWGGVAYYVGRATERFAESWWWGTCVLGGSCGSSLVMV